MRAAVALERSPCVRSAARRWRSASGSALSEAHHAAIAAAVARVLVPRPPGDRSHRGAHLRGAQIGVRHHPLEVDETALAAVVVQPLGLGHQPLKKAS
jgi:hypothetical protein